MRTLPEPWQNHKFLGTHRFEVCPFHYKGELYLLENFCDYDVADYAFDEYPPHTAKDGFLIRRYRDDQVIAQVSGSYFASAYALPNKVYVFGSKIVEEVKETTNADGTSLVEYVYSNSMHSILRYESEDLINWSEPEVIFEADPGCRIFNTSFAWNGEKFIGVYETDTPEKLYKYIFKFWETSDFKHLKTIEGAAYGLNKYVGANTMYFVGGYYYLLYLEDRLDGTYETRVARSRDLVNWQDSDIPVMTPDLAHEINPEKRPGGMELNASDLELIEDQGRTLAFFHGGDQHGCCDMQMAEYPGSMRDLLEYYFK